MMLKGCYGRCDGTDSSDTTEGADTTESADTIEITTCTNVAFAFRHVIAMSVADATYTITLDPGVCTIDELVAALIAAIATQGSDANTVATSIAYIY